MIIPNQSDTVEAGTVPGNSADAAPVVNATTEPQAQAAPGITRDDLKSFASDIRDGIFADLRKAGVFGKTSKANRQDAKEETAPTADDPSSLLALRDAFDDATSDLKLTKGQRQLLRESVMTKRPDDVDGYVSDYATRAGWNQAPVSSPNAVQAATAPKPQNAQPVSDRGAPPPSQVPLAEADLVTMSESDRAHLIKEKGLRWYKDHLAGQLKGRRMLLR
jgi:hypothetical protein